MRVGNWSQTIIAEEAFWVKYLRQFDTDESRNSNTVEFYSKRKAGIISMILERQGISLTHETCLLEIGGGLVEAIRYFPTGRLFAVDPLCELFDEQRKKLGKPWQAVRHDVTYISARAEDIPLDSGPFHIVVMLNSLDHCEDPEEVMRRVATIMPGGAWLFEQTTVWEIGGRGHKAPKPETYGKGHPHLFKGDELHQLIGGVGFWLIDDPLGDGSLDEIWSKPWKKGTWPCYLRVWRKDGPNA